MFKVLVWDYMGVSTQWLEQMTNRKQIEVVGTITPSESAPEILLKKDAWDWLLIFEQDARNFFEVTIRVLKLPLDRVIYAPDMKSWLNNPVAVYALLKPEICDYFYRSFNFSNHKRWHNYISASAEGLHYVATATDEGIILDMYLNSKNYASKEMKLFRTLAKKYYGVDDSEGYFLDLGANIGTTGIYFCKKLAPNLKLISFEPDPENFKMLRINAILNDMEDKATLVNCGLGDKFEEQKKCIGT